MGNPIATAIVTALIAAPCLADGDTDAAPLSGHYEGPTAAPGGFLDDLGDVVFGPINPSSAKDL